MTTWPVRPCDASYRSCWGWTVWGCTAWRARGRCGTRRCWHGERAERWPRRPRSAERWNAPASRCVRPPPAPATSGNQGCLRRRTDLHNNSHNRATVELMHRIVFAALIAAAVAQPRRDDISRDDRCNVSSNSCTGDITYCFSECIFPELYWLAAAMPRGKITPNTNNRRVYIEATQIRNIEQKKIYRAIQRSYQGTLPRSQRRANDCVILNLIHTVDADATQLSSCVPSASAVWTQFATSSRWLPTDSVDN